MTPNPDKARASQAMALKGIVDNLPMMIEYEMVQAKLRFAKYKALVAEGFTEAQALDLCKEWKA